MTKAKEKEADKKIRPHAFITTKPTLAKQSFKDESDINNIMARYVRNGQIPTVNPNKPTYGFAPEYDFKEAMDLVNNMTSNFDEMPEQIKAQFGYSPAKFLEFVENPENASKMADMGLLRETTNAPSELLKNAANGKIEALADDSDKNPIQTEDNQPK